MTPISKKEADGIILGSPGITAEMKWLLDRMGIASISNHEILRHKVGASVNAVRRAGGMETDNMLNNVMLFRKMIIVGSNYWNMVYGRDVDEFLNDDEGIVNIKKSVKIRPGCLRKSIILMTFLLRVKCLGVCIISKV